MNYTTKNISDLELTATVEVIYADHTYTATVNNLQAIARYLENETRPFKIGKVKVSKTVVHPTQREERYNWVAKLDNILHRKTHYFV